MMIMTMVMVVIMIKFSIMKLLSCFSVSWLLKLYIMGGYRPAQHFSRWAQAVAALHQGPPGQMTWLEDPPPWLRPVS